MGSNESSKVDNQLSNLDPAQLKSPNSNMYQSLNQEEKSQTMLLSRLVVAYSFHLLSISGNSAFLAS